MVAGKSFLLTIRALALKLPNPSSLLRASRFCMICAKRGGLSFGMIQQFGGCAGNGKFIQILRPLSLASLMLLLQSIPGLIGIFA
jgi:hypothetical protein